LAAPHDGRRRVIIERVQPAIDGGRFAIKRIVGETVRVSAWIHADGHDALAAVVRYRPAPPNGRTEWSEAPMTATGNDEWLASFTVTRLCPYEYTVQAWVDGFTSWRRGLRAKVDAGQSVSSELLEGVMLVRAAAARARQARATKDADWLEARAAEIGDATTDAVRAAVDDRLARLVSRFPDRSWATEYDRVLHVSVDRERARFGAWYEMFPRSWGPDPSRSATFREAEAHLGRIAAMGFDVVYLPPIHPIGHSFRKGRGNSLTAEPGDPGSPWAIGSRAGGHKAVDPGLGTLEDFDHFLAAARSLGLEVALDLAYQCSPDHPYVRSNPEWFRQRPDGTIKYAENPPKKYQDIYPFDFDTGAWPALWTELKSIVDFWIARGVSIFRVDNPHTKPYRFWEWLIRETRLRHPDVIFLSEAFTRPKVMYYLAKLGFTQSYTYFTWRNAKAEIAAYFTELVETEAGEFFRPNLFANTPDILHEFLQEGGIPAFKIRLILAATLGATYGIYSGFERCANQAVPGTEEYLNSEKYQFRRWDQGSEHIEDLVTIVNRIRHENPALHWDRSLRFCRTDNPHLIAYWKRSPDRTNAVLVVVNLDYEHMQHGWVDTPLDPIDPAQHGAYEVTDQLTGTRYTWRGERNYVRLDPRESVAHVLRLPVAPPEIVSRASEALAQFLPRQRWFAGKARTIVSARLVDWSPPAPTRERLTTAIAEVAYTDGGTERYFVPLAVVPDEDGRPTWGAGTIGRVADGTIVDALADDDACRTLLETVTLSRPIAMREGAVRATVHRPAGDLRRWPIARTAAEHSNSCAVFGRRYILKLIRRLDPGVNPELEISRALSNRGFERTPPLTATLEYDGPGAAPATLALLQGFVVNEGTGWDRAVEDARRFLTSRAPGEIRTAAFVPLAATLGQRTAELHLALAAVDDDPAFAPEPMTESHVAALVATLWQETEHALGVLAQRLAALPEPADELGRAVLDRRSRLVSHVGEFARIPAGSMRTRVHGDYHLGQVLCTGQDFVIIDFEGEPARTLEERRRKQSPLKDVAGMLRSFSYAAYQAVLKATEAQPDRADDFEAPAHMWEAATSTAFLTRYRETIAGASLVPAEDADFVRLLDAFLLEKAVYELDYELAGRPQWVNIPLIGILRLLEPDTRVDAR
jgi:starch synthase (maltosyl-transferring)